MLYPIIYSACAACTGIVIWLFMRTANNQLSSLQSDQETPQFVCPHIDMSPPCNADTLSAATIAEVDRAIRSLEERYNGDNTLIHAHIIRDLDELHRSGKAIRENVQLCAQHVGKTLHPNILISPLNEPTVRNVVQYMVQRGVPYEVRRSKLEFDISTHRNSNNITQQQGDVFLAVALSFNATFDQEHTPVENTDMQED